MGGGGGGGMGGGHGGGHGGGGMGGPKLDLGSIMMSAHRADRDGVPAYNCPSCCAWSQLVTAMLTAVDRSGCTDAAPAHFYPPAAFECCREQSLTVVVPTALNRRRLAAARQAR